MHEEDKVNPKVEQEVKDSEVRQKPELRQEVKEPELRQEVKEPKFEEDTTSLATLTAPIAELTKQIEKLEKMNQNLLIQQHVDDVDDSKLFSIFNRYNRKR